MEEQNRLDDLILKKSDRGNLKKLLLAASILLLVLIMIILITKSLIEPEKKPKSSVVLPPEPATQQAKAIPKEPLFEEVPIEEENEKAAAPIDRIIKTVKQQTPPPTQPSKPEPKPEPKPVAQTAKAAPEPVAQPKSTRPAKPAKTAATPPKPAPKPKPAARPVRTASSSSAVPYAELESGYYVQVGAFRTDPAKKFLRNIEKERLHYAVIETVRQGVRYKKVVIGPYPSRTAAKKALPHIKKRINQNAYIFHKK